jgi:hypothetical protein
MQIPYVAEQGNKSDEQGDNIDDQRINLAQTKTLAPENSP